MKKEAEFICNSINQLEKQYDKSEKDNKESENILRKVLNDEINNQIKSKNTNELFVEEFDYHELKSECQNISQI